MLLTGDAGIGKTRLLAEIGHRLGAAGTVVATGHAVPGCGPFRPLAEALVRIAPPELAADPRLRPFRSVLARVLPGWPAGTRGGVHLVDPVVVLGEAVLELLRVATAGRPCLLALDDLHWADRDTLALLEYLAGRLAELPVTVLGAARADEAAPAGLTALRRHPGVHTIELAALTAESIALLVRRTLDAEVGPEVLEFLRAASGGLPLLVEDLAVGLVEGGAVHRDGGCWGASGPLHARVPEAFTRLVERRLSALDAADRAVLHAAAALGPDLDWTLLPAATGRDRAQVAAALRAAVHARLLVTGTGPDDSETVRWRHALTRDAVLAALTPPERAALAARVAHALDDAPAQRPGLLADLHLRGGNPHRAAELLCAQARTQTDVGALVEASGVLDRAAELAAGQPELVAKVAVERVEVGDPAGVARLVVGFVRRDR